MVLPRYATGDRQPLPETGADMARRNINARKHARKFSKARRRSKVINSPNFVLRGGIRL